MRAEIIALEKENWRLSEEMQKLRKTVIGADFQAWDLHSLLTQFENLR